MSERLWLPPGVPRELSKAITITPGGPYQLTRNRNTPNIFGVLRETGEFVYLRPYVPPLVGICKCGHMWAMHLHGPKRPGSSCDLYRCKCKRYRLRRVRRIRTVTGKKGRQRRPEKAWY